MFVSRQLRLIRGSNSKCCSGSRERPGVVLAPDLAALETSYETNPTTSIAETTHDDPVFGEEVGAANVFDESPLGVKKRNRAPQLGRHKRRKLARDSAKEADSELPAPLTPAHIPEI